MNAVNEGGANREGGLVIAFLANSSWYLANFRLGIMKELIRRGMRVLALSPEDPYSEFIKAAGVEWFPVPLKRRHYNPLQKLQVVRAIRHIYRREKVDLVHHFTLEAIVMGTVAARYRYPKPPKIVQSVTGMGIVFSSRDKRWRIVRMGLIPFLRRTLPRGLVIVENELDRRRIGRLLGRHSRAEILTIPGGGVNTRRFHPEGKKLLPESNGAVRFLLAGRLLKEKGGALFAEAAGILANEGFEFLLAGEPDAGSGDSHTREEIEGWARLPGFTWLGGVERMDELLRSVDVLVHPTFYGEGLPRIIMEGGASGLPVIASSIAGCRELVQDGVNGWILRSKCAHELANLMKQAAGVGAAGRLEMGRKGRQFCEQRYSEGQATRATLDVYERYFPGVFKG